MQALWKEEGPSVICSDKYLTILIRDTYFSFLIETSVRLRSVKECYYDDVVDEQGLARPSASDLEPINQLLISLPLI